MRGPATEKAHVDLSVRLSTVGGGVIHFGKPELSNQSIKASHGSALPPAYICLALSLALRFCTSPASTPLDAFQGGSAALHDIVGTEMYWYWAKSKIDLPMSSYEGTPYSRDHLNKRYLLTLQDDSNLYSSCNDIRLYPYKQVRARQHS